MSPMDVSWAVNRPAPERTATRVKERDTARPSERNGIREDERDRTEEAGKPHRVSRSEFSALLALLAGAGPLVRQDLIEQLPEDAASLVDRLLTTEGHAGSDVSVDAWSASGTSGDAAPADAASSQGALVRMAGDDRPSDVIDLAAYARTAYARTTHARTAHAQSTQGDDTVEVPRTSSSDMTGAIADTTSRSMTDTNRGDEADVQRTRMLDALSRVSSRRSASVEQLLAIGDAKGADARAALDALLAQAGTPAGARLAARAIMSRTNASLLGVDETSSNLSALETLAAQRSGASDNPDLAALLAMAGNAPAGRATNGASGTDVTAPVKALAGLDPDLRARVERVVERMKNEYGHDVTVVETVRSQERQDWLYEQGRTREGSVVTWTRDSAHTHGEAVDVIIDGSYQNAAGFARLQRIAREEGLRTLGMKDPGHLELAQRSASSRTTTQSAANTNDPAGAAGVARVAGVASVATVARVADAQSTSSTGVGNIQTLAAQQTGRDSHNMSNNRDGAQSERQSTSSRSEHRRSEALGGNTDTTLPFGAASMSGPTNGATTGTERASSVSPTAGSDQAQRVSDIQQMRADAPAGPLARMTLNVDNANGTQEKITVDLRGNTVSTHISTDAATADRLRLRTAELQDALGRHGLDGDTVRISGARTETTDPSRVAGLDRDPLKTLATAASSGEGTANGQGGGQRDRATGERQREWQQDSSRREQASEARDDRQEQQGRQRRPNFFLGNE